MSLLSLSKKILRRDQKHDTAKKRGQSEAQKKDESAIAEVPVIAGNTGLTPLVTEKGIAAQMKNTVVFSVFPWVTKQQIAAAVQEKYGTPALSVKTLTVKPKTRRRGKSAGKTTVWKKAYVMVADAAKITNT
ncbi:MAG: 50S ribosomal protein L23 [Acidobacteriota bacterium]